MSKQNASFVPSASAALSRRCFCVALIRQQPKKMAILSLDASAMVSTRDLVCELVVRVSMFRLISPDHGHHFA